MGEAPARYHPVRVADANVENGRPALRSRVFNVLNKDRERLQSRVRDPLLSSPQRGARM